MKINKSSSFLPEDLLIKILSENMNINKSSSSFLTEDLLIEILLSLPIKTLVRFKSVSNSWFALIDSSDFIHRHVTTTTMPPPPQNNNNSKLEDTFIFQSSRIKENNSSWYWKLFTISCDDDHEYQEEAFGMAPCYKQKPINKSFGHLNMSGYCNGVVCLYNSERRDVSLWNPAIHQFRFLPKSSWSTTTDSYWYSDFIAFGFDIETKDYKVVLATEQPALVQVYSLSTDSWRTIEDNVLFKSTRPRNEYGGYLNGSYYCSSINITKKTREWEIISFDFTKEIFQTLQLPDELINNIEMLYCHDIGIVFVFIGGKIGIIHNVMHLYTYEFWVLNELGVKESWTKLYTVNTRPYGEELSMNGTIYHMPHGKEYRPIGISNNGEFIVMVTDRSQLSVFNRSTQVMNELYREKGNENFGSNIVRAFVYRHSLVPVCSTTNGSSYELKSQV